MTSAHQPATIVLVARCREVRVLDPNSKETYNVNCWIGETIWYLSGNVSWPYSLVDRGKLQVNHCLLIAWSNANQGYSYYLWFVSLASDKETSDSSIITHNMKCRMCISALCAEVDDIE